MPHLAELTTLAEQLVSTSVLVDPSDLTSLAELHTRLQTVGRWAEAAPDEARAWFGPVLEKIGSTASGAEKLVEQIVLAEVTDADTSLRQVYQTIIDLQAMIRGAGASGAEAVASPRVEPAALPAPPVDPTSIAAETPINPEDIALLQEFISEAASHLEIAERELLRLEDDPQNSEIIAAAFRSFHTIKGVAGFLNLKQVGALSHAAENLLDLARHGTLELSDGKCDLVLEAVDAMGTLVQSLASAIRDSTPIPVMPELPALLARLQACGVEPALAHDVQATNPSRGAGGMPIGGSAVEHEPASGDTSPVSALAASPPQQEATIKVATNRLDSLINMIGELVIAQAMVTQDAALLAAGNQRLGGNMSQLTKITRELQSLSMSMRMTPVAALFQKMARLVRDTARKIGKEVEFISIGGETEVDRNVVEAIADPLVHMVRNAVDHGIETPADRTRAGKLRAGRIELRARHQAGNVIIEISDDGSGIHQARLIRKAVEAGILHEGQQLTEPETFRLIFHPGLSTAEKVTDVSGRGVGMDVVKKNVEALRGRIDIHSVEGKGSVFTIRLPLTLALIDGLVVRVGSERYILPLTSVERSIRPTAGQLSTVRGRGEMLMVRERVLPLFRLHELFHVPPIHTDPATAIVVILCDEDRRYGLMIDELVGRQQVVIKSLDGAPGKVEGVSGGAILGDGNVSLILDVPGLIALASRQ